MKLPILLVAASQLSAGVLATGFFVYGGTYDISTGNSWAFFPKRPDICIPAMTAKTEYDISTYFQKDDVSHGRKGVVCEGDGCPQHENSQNGDWIDRLEFSTNFGHFTYYKVPHGELRGLDANLYGHCYALPQNTNAIQCTVPMQEDVFRGWAYFWCVLDGLPMTDNPL